MTQEHIAYVRPADIDGEPNEVANAVRDQLGELAPIVAELAEDSYVQVRNAWMSAALAREPGIGTDRLATAWDGSRLAARMAAVTAAADALAEAAGALQSGPKPPTPESHE